MIQSLNQLTQSQETLKNQIQTQKVSDTRVDQVSAIVAEETIEKKEEKAKTTVEKILNSEINISFHEKTNRILVKLVDPKTKEVLREIPPEKLVDMMASLGEEIGLFVDEKV